MATIEEIVSDQELEQATDKVTIKNGDDLDDDVPDLEAGDKPGLGASGMGGTGSIQKPQGRQERKARTSIKKLGLVPVTGVTRVAIRKSKSMLFVINKPDVFKNPGSDTYVVFGEAKVENPTGDMQQRTASQLDELAAANHQYTAASTSKSKVEGIVEDPVSDGGDSDSDESETGVDEKDIELVMTQATCSRKRAVRGLKKNDGDIVNTIMNLQIS